jgi:hypothetical protein
MRSAFIISVAIVILSGCASTQFNEDGSRTSSNTQKSDGIAHEKIIPTEPNEIIVTDKDITDRPYIALADLEVSASKLTVFNKDPTKEDINKRLRNEAAKLGADAVILARYGSVGISPMSWGKMEGRGRAIKFSEE